MKKKFVAAGLVAGLAAGTGAGLVLQLGGSAGAVGSSASSITAVGDDTDTTNDTTNDTTGDTTNDTAGDESGRPDPSERLQEVLKPLIDDNTLTQSQVDKVIETLVAAHEKDGGRGGRRGPGLEAIATSLGMTEAEVRDAISNGQTLAQLAEAKGSTAQMLIDVILADVKTHLDEAVAAGELTQDEADAKLAAATTHVTEFVNNTHPGGPMGGGDGTPEAPPAGG